MDIHHCIHPSLTHPLINFSALMAVQAKGWPLVSVLWAAWNLAFLLGRANSHWLSMQTLFDIFNSKNYGGDFLVSEAYRRILAAFFIVGFVVMVKRVCIALVLGKRTYGKFYQEIVLWLILSLQDPYSRHIYMDFQSLLEIRWSE